MSHSSSSGAQRTEAVAAATAVSPHGVLDRGTGDGAGEQELPQRRGHARRGDLSEVDEES